MTGLRKLFVPIEQPGMPAFTMQGLVLPVLFLVVALLVAISALLYHTANKQNEYAHHSDAHLAVSALTVVSDDIMKFVRDYANWDATVENVIETYDPEWVENNLGQWTIDGLHMDGSLVIGAENQIIHQANRAFPDETLSSADLSPDLVELIELARQQGLDSADAPIPVFGYFRGKDGINMTAASVIVTEDGLVPTFDGRTTGVIVFYRTITQALLADLSHRFLLNDLRVVPVISLKTRPFLPLITNAGKVIAGLRWTDLRPGTEMLYSLVVPMILAGIVVVAVFLVILHRARKVARLVRDYHTGLEAQARDLLDARDAAEAANRSKSHFLAMMSHELRTPLNAVIGFSDLIKADLDGSMSRDKIQDYASDINNSGTYLLSLINDILDMSKIEARRYELNENTIVLDDAIRQSISLVRGIANDKRIAIHTSSADIQIVADARAIKQILINLLSNAVKFSGEGSSIDIIVDRTSVGDLEIRITDQGIGMTESEIQKALTPFGQSSNAHIRNMRGTGLGLNICVALAELHNGSLHVDSAPRIGTTITIRLPAKRVVD